MFRIKHAGFGVAGGCLALMMAIGNPSPIHALGSEDVGNKPIADGFNFGAQLLTAVNVPERVYWNEVNGNPYFYFRGTPRDLNEAIRKFAAIPAERREIIVLPGRGVTTTFNREQRIDYDWILHVPAGLTYHDDPDLADNRATLTILISEPRPSPPADPAQVRLWIAELDSNEFKVRDKAARALEKLGRGVAPALRDALRATTSPEVHTRLEQLLRRLELVDLDTLLLPKEISVIGMETILQRCRQALKSEKASVRGYAVVRLANSSARSSEVLPDILRVLESEKDEYVVRCVASALGGLRAAAKPAAPTLREQMKKRDGVVQQAFQRALEIIENEKISDDMEADAKKQATIQKEISELLKGRAKTKAP